MKVAILTLPLHSNYGGVLQAYAMQHVLEKMGHNVDILLTPWQKKNPIYKLPFSYLKRFIFKYIFHKPCRIFYERWYNKTQPVLVANIHCFIRENLKYRKVSSFYDIAESDYDAFIVGSDQVWRPSYTYSPVELAFLSFAKFWGYKKRIAYAASFGTDKWEYTKSQNNICQQLIKKFNGVSLREKSGVDLCQQHFNIKASHVLDPTMLLEIDDYLQLFIKKKTVQSNGTLLTYILDEEINKLNIINLVSTSRNLLPFRVNSKYENWNAPLEERIQPPVEEWLRGFYDAEFVITDSFHATVFAILFRKPFIVIGNYKRGLSRIQSLLEMFDLKDHLIFSISDFNISNDYCLDSLLISEHLNKWKTHSLNFLKQSLEE